MEAEPIEYIRTPKTIAADSPNHRQAVGDGKTCRKCKRFLPFGDFFWNSAVSSGRKYRTSSCKDCSNAKRCAWAATAHGQRSSKSSKLLKTYGITLDEYESRLAAQGGACAVCGDTETPIDPRTGKKYDLAIDHDHATGRVRGLLCPACNNGLGCFKDDPVRLHSAISYLKEHASTS